jgi:hypothetical protein
MLPETHCKGKKKFHHEISLLRLNAIGKDFEGSETGKDEAARRLPGGQM